MDTIWPNPIVFLCHSSWVSEDFGTVKLYSIVLCHLWKNLCCRYVHYCMKYVNSLLAFGLRPIMVFDGCRLPSKRNVEKARREYVTGNVQVTCLKTFIQPSRPAARLLNQLLLLHFSLIVLVTNMSKK